MSGGNKPSQVIYKSYPKLKWGHNKWQKNGMKPLNPEYTYVPFKPKGPVKLRNFVTGAGTKSSDVVCIPEMMSLFECLALNDHNQKNCESFVVPLQECWARHMVTQGERGKKDQTIPIPGKRDLTAGQVNTLLSRYPQKNN